MLRFLWISLFLLMSIKGSEQGCTLPHDELVGGYYTPRKDTYEYDDQVEFFCEEGYNLTGGSKTRTCQGLAQVNAWYWSGKTPKCALMDCGSPLIPNAQYDEPETTAFRSTFTYKCNTGWAPDGPQEATCTSEATWDYAPCRELEFHCSNPPQVNHAAPNASLTRQKHGTIIHYACDSGYSLQGSAILECKETKWVGSLPTCTAETFLLTTKSQLETEAENNFNKTVLPIIAGVVTALLLTVALTVTVLCLRRRQKKAKEESPESTATTTPVSTPAQQHQGIDLKATGTGSSTGGAVAADTTLPYHRIICPHSHLVAPNEQRKRNNYVPDASLAQFRPLVGNYEQVHSSSPSTVQSETSATDAKFHTIRECLGDFKNNNLPNTNPSTSQTLGHQPSQTLAHPPSQTLAHPPSQTLAPQPNQTLAHPPSQTLAHQANQTLAHQPSQTLAHPPSQTLAHPPHRHRMCPNGGRSASAGHFTRTLWTADGRPYEAVTCAHGVEHVYQPLEHIYEEPHIWMRPLPNPQQ